MLVDPSTYFDARALADFVHGASRTPLPEPEEERRLAAAARSGDEGALDGLIRSHLRLVVDVAIALRGDVPVARLIPAGLEGLIVAADRYDPGHGGTFRAFARPYVRRRMRDALFPELARTD